MKAWIPALALLVLNLTEGAPTKTTYMYSGKQVESDIYGQEDGCLNGSYISLKAHESVSKLEANGKPETKKYPYVSASYDRWYNCYSGSITNTHIGFYDAAPTSVDIKTNLKSASVSSTVHTLVVTEVCDVPCGEYECGEEGGDSKTCPYCWTECPEEGTDPEYEWAEVTLQATFVGTGTPYPSTSKIIRRDPYEFFHSKSSDTTMSATVSSISITVKGVNGTTIPMPIPPDDDKSAYISTTKTGSFTRYLNGN